MRNSRKAIGALTGALLSLALAMNLAGAAAKTARQVIRVPFWAEQGEWKPADLKAKLDGAPAQIAGIHGPDEDLMLLVVFDVTGDVSLVDPARESLIAALAKAPATMHIGLMRAQDGLSVLLDPTADREALAQAIRAVPVSGRPGLLDTVEQAAALADTLIEKTSIRLALLYITDSNIYDYREDYTNPVVNSSDYRDLSRRFPEGLVKEKISKLEHAVGQLDAPIFVVHLAYQRDRLNEAYQSGLLQVAQATGGNALFCRSLAEIPDAIDKTLERITNHWAVDLKLPERSRKSVQIQLEGATGLSYRNRFLIKEK